MTCTEEQIKKAIVDRISSDARIDASNIGVHVSEGRVVLRGTVASGSESDFAEASALRAAGVTAVENQLEVRAPEAEAAPTDEELESQIQAALSESPRTRDRRFRVTVRDGVATLAGTVDTLWLKAQVERIASEPSGVSGVENHLEVLPPEPVPDPTIAKAILDALKRSESIDAETVDVRVEEGVVTLSGSVSSNSASQIACNVAFNTVGVKDLQSNLAVRAPS